jgi:hypothetical protein
MFSMGEAARQSGMSKATIHRHIKSGKLSAVRNADGSYAIDPAELFRAYPAPKQPETVSERQHETPVTPDETGREIALLRERVEELKQDRDAWRQQAERLLLNGPEPKRTSGFLGLFRR